MCETSAPYRSSPGSFSRASSPMWRWWLVLCFMRPDTPPCSGAASPSRLARSSAPSPCSLWSMSITCFPGLRSVWITAANGDNVEWELSSFPKGGKVFRLEFKSSWGHVKHQACHEGGLRAGTESNFRMGRLCCCRLACVGSHTTSFFVGSHNVSLSLTVFANPRTTLTTDMFTARKQQAASHDLLVLKQVLENFLIFTKRHWMFQQIPF